MAIPTRPARLLKESFDIGGDIAMDHGADIAFIHAHAIGAGGAQDGILVIEEPGLHRIAFTALQPRMIVAYVGIVQPAGEFPGRLLAQQSGGTEDDGGTPG